MGSSLLKRNHNFFTAPINIVLLQIYLNKYNFTHQQNRNNQIALKKTLSVTKISLTAGLKRGSCFTVKLYVCSGRVFVFIYQLKCRNNPLIKQLRFQQMSISSGWIYILGKKKVFLVGFTIQNILRNYSITIQGSKGIRQWPMN